MSLYAEYLKERTGKDIVEVEEGFATYSFMEDGVYIENIYVKPEFRKKGVASVLANSIEGIAKDEGYRFLYGSVCPSTNGSTDSVKVLLAYGFNLDSCTNNFILFKKEI